MTLQSLCSAIRSQLYFSQITAWSDLLKTSSHNDSEIQSNPRIKHFSFKPPKLDILYRIRPYDTTACFKSKPNIHNFPDAIITENLTVKVCLKSLPRLNEIPKLQHETQIPDAIKCLTQPMVVDDRLTHPCTEKGKHRCAYDDESVTDEMDASPTPTTVTHRDRQLLKYRKRMQRRDRKKQRSEDAMDSDGFAAGPSSDQPMTSTLVRQDSINSIRLPLYSCLTSKSNSPINTAAHITKSTQTANIEKRSISTQTDCDDPPYPNCNYCGIEMQLVCWNCDTKLFEVTDRKQTSPPKHVDKANLLLQAMQRTPSRKQRAQRKSEGNSRKEVGNTNSNTNNCHQSASDNLTCERSVCDSVGVEFSDCRLCKRQKTVHNYLGHNNLSNKNALSDAMLNNKENEMDDDAVADRSSTFYRRTMSESLGESDDASNVPSYHRTNITKTELKMYRRAYSEDVLSCSCDDDVVVNKSGRPKQLDLLQANSGLPIDNFIENQFNTPKNHRQPCPTNFKTNPLYISCRDDDNSADPNDIDDKLLPKINLTSAFAISPQMDNGSTSSPKYADLPSASAFTFENISPVLSSTSICSAGVVHKSFSAPTFPHHHSPALSPRFLKSAAILRRRSRHLSDRSSERSSIGSDEQFSDEDLGCGLDNTYSPVISPTKTATKPFPKSYPFGRRSLLGGLFTVLCS